MADRQVDRGLRERGVSAGPDVAIIGGGIVGCAAAALLAEAGAKVEVYERDEVGAAASGRNSARSQHPFDPVLAELHGETLEHYRALEGLELPDAPGGRADAGAEARRSSRPWQRSRATAPSSTPTLLEPARAAPLEPAVHRGAMGVPARDRLPGAPGRGHARVRPPRARGGRRFHEGETAWPWVTGGRARGVLAAGVRRPAGAVLVAAGPWTPEVIDTTRTWQPIVPVWGWWRRWRWANRRRHVLEEAGVEELAAGAGAASGADLQPGRGGRPGLGGLDIPRARRRRARGLGGPAAARAASASSPGWRGRRVVGARACPRPQSLDGRPLVGELPGLEGLWAAAGHGPWGISTGARERPRGRGRPARAGPGPAGAVGGPLLAGLGGLDGSGRMITVSATLMISSAPEAGFARVARGAPPGSQPRRCSTVPRVPPSSCEHVDCGSSGRPSRVARPPRFERAAPASSSSPGCQPVAAENHVGVHA